MAPRRKRQQKINTTLRRVFYDTKHPESYGGIDSTVRGSKGKLKKAVVKNWLSSQDTYVRHKQLVRNFTRRRVIVGSIDQQFQADLVDVAKLAKHNNGYRYILTTIDVLSKFAFAEPLLDKTGKSLVQAFKKIFNTGRKCKTLQTDKGTEFTNRVFQKFLKDVGVDFFTTHNEETKASIVERFNRTLKSRMWKYFTAKNTLRYLDVLHNLVWSYNNSYHRSIKMTPVSVTPANQEKVWQTLYGSVVKQTTPKFEVGDRVVISMAKRPFRKGYLPNWTEEFFTIDVLVSGTPPTYKVRDDHGDTLEGTFYEQELQKVANRKVYKVESILKSRNRKNKTEYLVKWAGYPTSFNSWLSKRQLVTYNS